MEVTKKALVTPLDYDKPVDKAATPLEFEFCT
jgi:hypothetical protein